MALSVQVLPLVWAVKKCYGTSDRERIALPEPGEHSLVRTLDMLGAGVGGGQGVSENVPDPVWNWWA
jgi:hypothetical protein